MAVKLKEHIKINSLYNPYQTAYKQGRSTETALISIKNYVHLSLSKGVPTALVLINLSTTFDTADHCIFSGVCHPSLECVDPLVYFSPKSVLHYQICAISSKLALPYQICSSSSLGFHRGVSWSYTAVIYNSTEVGY